LNWFECCAAITCQKSEKLRFGAKDRGDYRQAAGAVAQRVKADNNGSVSVSSKKETSEEKQAQHFGQCQT